MCEGTSQPIVQCGLISPMSLTVIGVGPQCACSETIRSVRTEGTIVDDVDDDLRRRRVS